MIKFGTEIPSMENGELPKYEWMHFSWATSRIVNGYVDEGWELYSEYTDATNGNNWIVTLRRIKK